VDKEISHKQQGLWNKAQETISEKGGCLRDHFKMVSHCGGLWVWERWE